MIETMWDGSGMRSAPRSRGTLAPRVLTDDCPFRCTTSSCEFVYNHCRLWYGYDRWPE
jgi:hypothetical protein